MKHPGGSIESFLRTNTSTQEQLITCICVLIDKGLITREEIEAMHVKLNATMEGVRLDHVIDEYTRDGNE